MPWGPTGRAFFRFCCVGGNMSKIAQSAAARHLRRSALIKLQKYTFFPNRRKYFCFFVFPTPLLGLGGRLMSDLRRVCLQ